MIIMNKAGKPIKKMDSKQWRHVDNRSFFLGMERNVNIVFAFYSDESLESFVNVMKKFSIAKILISLT